jgi:hypothetical protein
MSQNIAKGGNLAAELFAWQRCDILKNGKNVPESQNR